MRKFTTSDWKNFLKITALPLLSLLAVLVALTSYAMAGRLESAGGFVPDERPVPAPTELDELAYYRWTYQVSKIPPASRIGADAAESYDRLIASKEEEAHGTAGTTPEEMDNPAAKAKFEEALKESFRADFNDRAPGPYQRFIWNWFQQEKAYEAGRAIELAHLKTEAGRNQWIARRLANARFEADRGNAAEITSVNTARMNCMRSWSAMLGTASQTERLCRPVQAQEENLRKKREAFVAPLVSRLVTDAQALESPEARAAEGELRTYLENMEASPFLRPEIYARLKDNPERLYIDVESAKWQNMLVEISPDSKGVPTRSTVGFDAYAIYDAPIDAVRAVYQWRNGIPSGQQQLKKNPIVVFPVDGLFNYRREESIDFSDYWGPGAYFNRSIKWNANRSVVKGLMDSYALLERGDAERGYDIVFQLLGKGCPPQAELRADRCSTQTSSNFTIAILRPLPDGKTVFKLSGRFVGQSYGAPLPDGLNTIGFSIENFRKGQLEFAAQAAAYASVSARIKQAEAAGERVERVSSEQGFYFQNGQVVRLNSGDRPNPRTQFVISPEQNFFQINGREIVQLIHDRGSQPYTARAVPMAMQTVPLEWLFSE